MLQSYYFRPLVYYVGFGAAAIFILSYFLPVLFPLGVAGLICLSIAILVDSFLLYGKKQGLLAARHLQERFSNGDENKVQIHLENNYGFSLRCRVIDELPFQLQERSWERYVEVNRDATQDVLYSVTPNERGEYHFGDIQVFVSSPLGIICRKYSFPSGTTVKVYPSFFQMRRYQLLSAANRLQEAGVKRTRRLGHSLEFEQIKEYVRGDDYRTINWKATARRDGLMVNNFTDERSQQIYCVINKGRIMKMPFEGLTLLDYAINASLVLSNVALMRQDKAGLITYAEKLDTFLPADKKASQLNLILESLYKQTTNFLEPDLEKLFAAIRNRITQRSLLVLFTNYESMESLHRDLPSLKRIAHYHLLLIVFFENTELQQLITSEANNTEDIYIKTIAEKYNHEKRLMVKELQMNGISAVLTQPQNLTINAINKYLELKNRQSI
ncbi:DUF58 domain-containing protein [Flavisolibacter tropicus]|uniref:Cell division protein DivIC (FtsB), stabilizes FtsL against RasP cleavage n=1 Tax=Flavisolibacter tropicus TaxID=1492898 RepID=A0A172U3Y7_9BACT|nr:DUF58 domain-containing protein [Flavisolibacter tropicus]ANE53697.1 cell division protein DivIC (FtsB), stabilizes FtsL against RasP cleavage [Flavisolibacter tropicus]